MYEIELYFEKNGDEYSYGSGCCRHRKIRAWYNPLRWLFGCSTTKWFSHDDLKTTPYKKTIFSPSMEMSDIFTALRGRDVINGNIKLGPDNVQ
jgi:hypothetical protein